MTEATLLVRGGTLPPLEELYELTGNDHIDQLFVQDVVAGYVILWNDVKVHMRLLPHEETTPLLAQVKALAEEKLQGREDNKARKNLRRVSLADTAIHITIEPEPDSANKARDLVLGVLAYYEDSMLWGEGALYNENAKRFIGDEEARTRFFIDSVPEDSAEATERRARSVAVLRREKIPYIEHLAVIADSTQTQSPTVSQIIERLVALVCIADRAEGGTLADYDTRIRALGLEAAVTPDERTYANEESPIEQDTIKFSQRLEAAWTLAWALGFVDTLKRPDEFCDVDALRGWASQPLSALNHKARLRPVSDILDMTDLHYRYHWAVNDAELYGTRMPGHLIPAVAYERHYALNWLISNSAWDQVPTDT